MTPEERLEEGEAVVRRVAESKEYSWGRFKALMAYASWMREHGCLVLKHARMTQRVNAEIRRERDALKKRIERYLDMS